LWIIEKSFVVREALRYFADRENIERALDAVLGRRDAREAMEAGLAAWSRGDIVAHKRVVREVRRPKRSR
jgi:predicted transcriptional regulator